MGMLFHIAEIAVLLALAYSLGWGLGYLARRATVGKPKASNIPAERMAIVTGEPVAADAPVKAPVVAPVAAPPLPDHRRPAEAPVVAPAIAAVPATQPGRAWAGEIAGRVATQHVHAVPAPAAPLPAVFEPVVASAAVPPGMDSVIDAPVDAVPEVPTAAETARNVAFEALEAALAREVQAAPTATARDDVAGEMPTEVETAALAALEAALSPEVAPAELVASGGDTKPGQGDSATLDAPPLAEAAPVARQPQPAPVRPFDEADEDAAMRAIEGGWSRRAARALPDAPELSDVSAAVSAAQLAVEQVLARAGIEVDEDGFGKPRGLLRPREGGRDDLKAIAGLAPLDETTLNNFGIFHFDQIAGWTEREVLWLENHAFAPGRIARENWQGQARALAAAAA